MTYTLYFLNSHRGRKPRQLEFFVRDDRAAQEYAEAMCEESGFVMLNVFTEDEDPLYELVR